MATLLSLLISLSFLLGFSAAEPVTLGGATGCPAPNPSLYYRPVIGIVSHPGDGASWRLSNATDASNIPASYVKFVESGGARVIPLIYNEPPEILFEKLNLVNGVLFTGGWAKEGLYFETIQKIFQIILERNDAGEHFPLFAICLGFELVSMIVSKDHDICERFAGEDLPSTLHFSNSAVIQGSVFQRFPPKLLRKMSTDCLAMQNHKYGLSPKRLHDNDALSNFFKILTTTTDENNEAYISTAQAYNYPVTCFQWHPEKNAFEWGLPNIPHTDDAIQVTQNMASYFISEARKSSNRPDAQKVLDHLIYNYSPTYGGYAGKGYDEVYIFSPSSEMSISEVLGQLELITRPRKGTWAELRQKVRLKVSEGSKALEAKQKHSHKRKEGRRGGGRSRSASHWQGTIAKLE